MLDPRNRRARAGLAQPVREVDALGRRVNVDVERSTPDESVAAARNADASIDEREHSEGKGEDEEQVDQDVAAGGGAGGFLRAHEGASVSTVVIIDQR